MVKYIGMIVLMFVSVACAWDAPASDDSLGQVILGLLILGTFSGVIPVIIILLLCFFGSGTGKIITKIATTDYSEIPEEEKSVTMANELKKASKRFK